MTNEEIEKERTLVYERAASRLAAAAKPIVTSTWANQHVATTLSDILAAVNSLDFSGPAGYAVHPSDIQKLQRIFLPSPYDGASSLVNGGRMLFGIEIISDDRVQVGRPEPLTASEIRRRAGEKAS